MSIGSDLLRFSDRKIIVLDGESQRLNLMMDNLPFQWAWLVTQRGKVLERHSHYIKWPNFKMSADAARITRFNPEWVANGENPKVVLQKWESYAMDEQYLLGGHNIILFDNPLWQLWRVELGLPKDWSAQYRMLDTHLLSRAYKMGWKPDRENLMAWFVKVSNGYQKGVKTGLALMAKELGIPVDESRTHDGLYDIEINAALLWKLLNVMEI